MDVSIGVMAYNEEKNIALLLQRLLGQKTKKVTIKEIVVVSCSDDNTNSIVKNFEKKNSVVRLLVEAQREGKSAAINKFLKEANSDVIVLESADTLPEKNAVEQLCNPLRAERIGVVGAKVIPLAGNNDFFNYVSTLLWGLHHELALHKPKFGEMVAFRHPKEELSNTAVDEEEIASMMELQGLRIVYEPGAVVYNKGPENVKDFIIQRRRIYCGHLALKKKGYIVSTLNSLKVLKAALKIYPFLKKPLYFLGASILEMTGRTLGLIDYLRKKDHLVWKTAKTTKNPVLKESL